MARITQVDTSCEDDRNKRSYPSSLHVSKTHRPKRIRPSNRPPQFARYASINLKANIVVGIDMSLQSPCFCMWHRETDRREFCFVQQQQTLRCRNVESCSEWRQPDGAIVRWHLWRPDQRPTYASGNRPQMFRYMVALIDWLMQQLVRFVERHGEHSSRVQVFIEGYACAYRTKASALLQELGGILREHLSRHGWAWQEIPPRSLKRIYADSGKATKVDMMTKYLFRDGWRLPLCVLSKRCKNNWEAVHCPSDLPPVIPHPFEDIVDAFAITKCAEIVLAKFQAEQ